MTHERNPQAKQMADESMVRGLKAQAEAIWPQEREILGRYSLPREARILDVGCGTGEITRRLAEMLPGAVVTGIDLLESHLVLARAAARHLEPRVEFRSGDAFAMQIEDDSVDLALCRHLLQAVPHPERVVDELIRVTKPGGRIHLVAEDYAMMHFHPTGTDIDTDLFWHRGPISFARETGSDLRSGRRVVGYLQKSAVREITVDYVVVDTLRVPRETLAAIWEAWRDGYAEAIAEHTELTLPEVHAAWREMLEAIRSPEGYGVWLLPVVGAVVS